MAKAVRMDYAPSAYERLISPRYAPIADALVEAADLRPGEHALELAASLPRRIVRGRPERADLRAEQVGGAGGGQARARAGRAARARHVGHLLRRGADDVRCAPGAPAAAVSLGGSG